MNGDADLVRLAMAATLADKSLDKMGRVDLGGVETSLRRTSVAARDLDSSTASIDRFSGRLGLLADAALILGPTLGPLSTVAVAGVAGLANQMGFAALAGGTMVLAMQGVGDALTEVNKAALEPSEENFNKAREAMAKLAPQARQLVLALHDAGPMFKSFKEAAGKDLFDDLIRGVEDLEAMAPRLRSLLREVGGAAGDAIGDSADSLASERWAPFIAFLESEARPTLTTMATTVGDLTHGLAELWMAMAPVNTSFGDWLAGVADRFDAWASSLEGSDGLQSFFDYLAETGPQVGETLGSIASMLLQLGEAAAPLGGPVLRGLEVLADTLATIADTPVGTALIAAAVGFRAISRAQQGYVAMTGVASARTRTFMTDLRTMQSVGIVAWGRTAEQQSAYAAAAGRTKATIAGFAKSTALVGGLALATSGLTDKVGLTNTATMALAGSLAGPWGAAVGGGVGLVMDLTKANDGLEESVRGVDKAVREGSILDLAEHQKALNAELAASQDRDIGGIFSNIGKDLGWLFDGNLSSRYEVIQDESRDAAAATRDLEQALFEVGTALGENMNPKDAQGRSLGADLQQMERVARSAAPAMQALGYSWSQLQNMDSDELDVAARRIAAWMRNADSAEGRTRNLADAFGGLSNEVAPLEERIDALKSSLDALFSPMDVAAARDAWHQSLNTLNEDLSENSRRLLGNGTAAIQNRDAIRDRLDAFKDTIVAEAQAGTSAQDLAIKVRHQRRALIDTATAAGLNRDAVRDLINEYGLTPETVQTIIKQVGADEVTAKVRAVQTLVDRFGMTKAQAKALLADLASGRISKVQQLINQYGMSEKAATALLKDLASGRIAAVQSALNNLRDKTVTLTTVYKVVRNTTDALPDRSLYKAAGGYINGPGTATSDSIPAWLSNGEYVVNAAATRQYREILEAINARRYASGGYVSRVPIPSSAPSAVTVTAGGLSDSDITRLARAVRDGALAGTSGVPRQMAGVANGALNDRENRWRDLDG